MVVDGMDGGCVITIEFVVKCEWAFNLMVLDDGSVLEIMV
jgi:hypothetical protein